MTRCGASVESTVKRSETCYFEAMCGGATNRSWRMVENLSCLYPVEVAQVGCILAHTIASLPPA
jgi:hypothetical protein